MYSLAHVVPAALMELLRATPMSEGKARFVWQAAVGPALDRATEVKLEGSVLVVATSSAQWAQEVRRSGKVILRRLQQFLGEDTVTSISVRGLSGSGTPGTSRTVRTPGTPRTP